VIPVSVVDGVAAEGWALLWPCEVVHRYQPGRQATAVPGRWACPSV